MLWVFFCAHENPILLHTIVRQTTISISWNKCAYYFYNSPINLTSILQIIPLIALLLTACTVKSNQTVTPTDAQEPPILEERQPTVLEQAKKGDPDAQYTYANQSLGQISPDEQFYWYLQSAENGYTLAQETVHYMYYRGLGVPQNFISSYAWLLISHAHTGERIDAAGLMEKLSPTQIAEGQKLAAELFATIEERKKEVCRVFGSKFSKRGISCPYIR